MTRKDVLDAAEKCVCGDREQDYGTPEDSFQVIANLWAAILCGARSYSRQNNEISTKTRYEYVNKSYQTRCRDPL